MDSRSTPQIWSRFVTFEGILRLMLDKEIDSKVESKFNSLQSVLTKTVDSQMEMLRTEM